MSALMMLPIIDLLRSVHCSASLPPRSEAFYEQVREDAELFGIGAQLCWKLRETGLFNRLPIFMAEWLQARAEKALGQNLLIKTEQERIFALFEKHGINAISLKGVLFAIQYFGHLGARGTSDIDLLLRESDIGQAEELLIALGYVREQMPDRTHFHAEYIKPLPEVNDVMRVEIHRSLLRNHVSRLDMDYFWLGATRVKGYRFIWQLSLQRTFYAICLHTANHELRGIRHILDVVRLLDCHAAEIDFGELLKQARRDQTQQRVLISLNAAYLLFPRFHQSKPLPRRKRLWFWNTEMIRDAARAKKGVAYYLFIFFYPLYALDTWRHRLTHMRYLVAPPKDFAAYKLSMARNEGFMRICAALYKKRLKLFWANLSGDRKKGTTNG